MVRKNFIILISLSFFISVSVFGQKTDSVKTDSVILQKDTLKQEPAKPAVKQEPAKPAKEKGPFKDSLRLALEKMPRQAAFISAILPGLGQVYNKRWWKVPLIYGGFVGLGLVFEFNNRWYQLFLKEAQYRDQNPGQKENPLFATVSDAGIILIKDDYRRNRDLSIIAGVAFYAINIIDAYVDAKFFRFDISDNLALKIKPSIQAEPFTNAYIPAIKLSLYLGKR